VSLARVYWRLGQVQDARREFTGVLRRSSDEGERSYLKLCLAALDSPARPDPHAFGSPSEIRGDAASNLPSAILTAPDVRLGTLEQIDGVSRIPILRGAAGQVPGGRSPVPGPGDHSPADRQWFALRAGSDFFQFGEFDSAIDCLRQARSPDPSTPDLRRAAAEFFLAMSHHRLGRQREAREAIANAAANLAQAPNVGGPHSAAEVADRIVCELIGRRARELIDTASGPRRDGR